MLVLSRKTGECIVIGEGIVVKVLHTEGGKVRLGIEAPQYIPIWRQEVRTAKTPQDDYETSQVVSCP